MVFRSKIRERAETNIPGWIIKIIKKVVKAILVRRGMRHTKGALHYDNSKETIIIVSHEASETGAPILALNMCQKLSKTANL